MTPVRVAMRTAAPRIPDGGCGCGGGCGGCGEKTSRCCGVECLVRPNFYCGQLLNDSDLSAMVQWSRDRFALTRYRDGWGVVCGLEVTCSAPEGAGAGGCGCGCGGTSSKGPALWIGAGYAVDCCGNDLVACDPIRVDLGSLCRPADDPCADPCAPPVKEIPDKRGEETVDLEGMRIPRKELIVADLMLRYAEQPVGGQRPMFGGKCQDQDACEFSRIREVPKAVLVPSDDDPKDPDPRRGEYEKKLLDMVREQIRRIMALIQPTDRETLIRRLSEWRIYSECFLIDWVRAQDVINEEIQLKIGMWLYLDWITHMNVCQCTTCRSDAGVPLARVILWRKDGRTDCCRPLIVIARAPFRRDLSRDCRPPATAKMDLLRWGGARAAYVAAEMKAEPLRVEMVESRDSLAKMENTVFSANPADRLRAHVVKDLRGERRIIGFEGGLG